MWQGIHQSSSSSSSSKTTNNNSHIPGISHKQRNCFLSERSFESSWWLTHCAMMVLLTAYYWKDSLLEPKVLMFIKQCRWKAKAVGIRQAHPPWTAFMGHYGIGFQRLKVTCLSPYARAGTIWVWNQSMTIPRSWMIPFNMLKKFFGYKSWKPIGKTFRREFCASVLIILISVEFNAIALPFHNVPLWWNWDSLLAPGFWLFALSVFQLFYHCEDWN